MLKWSGFQMPGSSCTEPFKYGTTRNSDLHCILFQGTFGVAHHQLEEERRFSSIESQSKTSKVQRPRLVGHEPLTAIKNIRTNSFGKLVSLTATVIR